MGDYRKLDVWKRARTLANRARQLTKTLSPIDQAGIGEQLLPPEYQDLKTETSGVRSMLVGFHRTVTTKKRKPRGDDNR